MSFEGAESIKGNLSSKLPTINFERSEPARPPCACVDRKRFENSLLQDYSHENCVEVVGQRQCGSDGDANIGSKQRSYVCTSQTTTIYLAADEVGDTSTRNRDRPGKNILAAIKPSNGYPAQVHLLDRGGRCRKGAWRNDGSGCEQHDPCGTSSRGRRAEENDNSSVPEHRRKMRAVRAFGGVRPVQGHLRPGAQEVLSCRSSRIA